MDSSAVIAGGFTGGPLDGLRFELPAADGMVGASLILLLNDPDGSDVRRHQYNLAPGDITNRMEYIGELSAGPPQD